MPPRARLMMAAALALLVSTACGYHVAGKGDQIPKTVRVIAIPTFANKTTTSRIEAVLTEAVVREFNTRTRFKIVSNATDADAVLTGTVATAQLAPLTYDTQTGRAASGLVTITMKVKLEDNQGHVLYENNAYVFREQYQISRELSSFFEEEDPAMKRLSQDFARTLVSDVMEAF